MTNPSVQAEEWPQGGHRDPKASTVVLTYLQFQLPVVIHSPKILNENSRNKQLLSFKLHAVLSMMKSHVLCLGYDSSFCSKYPAP